ncbi:MAG: amidohydrolase [Alphaproteobacteria bacterium]
MLIRTAAIALALTLFPSGQSAQAAEVIYLNGPILTMAGPEPAYVEALVVDGGKISFAGAKAEALRLQTPDTKLVDLQGHALLPGFIDGHGHMIYYGKNMIDADLVGVTSVAEVVTRMKVQAQKMGPDDWIVGFGYRVPSLIENRHPTAAELDQISADRPIMVVDQSGHNGAANTAMLKMLGLTKDTPDPEGGSFGRNADGTLSGELEETALFAVREQRPGFSGKLADDVALNGSRIWASYGQTTAQECGVGLGKDDIDIIRNAIDKKLLPIDLYLCAKDSMVSDVLAAAYATSSEYETNATGTAEKLLAERPDIDKRYINRVRLGGIKLWLDGSVPTTWLSEVYAHNPPGKEGDYRGFAQVSDAYLDEFFDKFWTSNLQINMHMNGDAAAEQALVAIERAIKKQGMADHRPVFIHATYMRPDQIKRMKDVGGFPTFTVGSLPLGGDMAVYYWGKARVDASMAMNTLETMGIMFSLNHDAPILPLPDVMALVDAAVNRTTGTGMVVGEDEKISAYVALRAVTAYPAYQIKEEKTKGTLEVGKLADLVILDQDPLKADPKSLKDIKVLETIKEGKTIYQRQ